MARKSAPTVHHTDPSAVVSPRRKWELTRVLFDGGEDSWSAAEGRWDGKRRLALRWNGGPPPESTLGNPQSRGLPTWFILPPELEPEVRAALARLRAIDLEGPLEDVILAIGRRCAGLPDRDARSPDEILGYDESGLPA